MKDFGSLVADDGVPEGLLESCFWQMVYPLGENHVANNLALVKKYRPNLAKRLAVAIAQQRNLPSTPPSELTASFGSYLTMLPPGSP